MQEARRPQRKGAGIPLAWLNVSDRSDDVTYGAVLNATNCMIHAPDERGAVAL
jgi:hypothetical protein